MILRSDVPRFTALWLLALAIVAAIGLPTFAGLAEGKDKSVAASSVGTSETVSDLVTRVGDARAKMYYAIQSGKGTLAHTRRTQRTLLSDTHTIAFSGDRLSVSRVGTFKVDNRPTPVDVLYLCDGARLTRTTTSQKHKTLYPVDSADGRYEVERARRQFDMVSQAYDAGGDPMGLFRGRNSTPARRARILGHETIDGSKCTIVEVVHAYPLAKGSYYIDTRHIWIDPNRNYIIPRVRIQDESRPARKTALSETNVHFRRVDSMWVPVSFNQTKYKVDPKTKKRHITGVESITYSADFALNVPVTDAELNPPTPQPKTRPTAAPPQPVEPQASTKPMSKPSTPAAQPNPPAPTSRYTLPIDGRIITPFGYRTHPITGFNKLHTGVDVAASNGTPIKAVAAGKVIKAGWYSAYGYAVIIDQGDGVTTLVGHCSKLAASEGQQVRKGDVIAYSGSTGYSTGPHLHYEKRVNGKPVDPLESTTL